MSKIDSPALGGRSRSTTPVLVVLAYAVFMLSALQTLVVPIVNDIRASLGTSASAVSWVVTANLLAAAVLTPLLGRLGDIRGRRPVLLGILVAVIVGSLIGAVTHSLPLLLVGRVLQGASYGIFPLSIGVLRDELPRERLTGAMALVGGMLSVGGGVALVATGLMTQHGGDYRHVFWLATGLGVVALIGAWFAIPRREPAATGRVDWWGGAILGLALVLLLTPLSQGNTWGWSSPRVLGSLIASAIVFTGFVLFERRIEHPLVSTRMLTHRPIVITNVAGLFLGVSMFLGFLGLSAFVETPSGLAGYGFSATVLAASVVYLLPGAVSGVITAPLGGRLVNRFGGKVTLIIAMLLAAAGFTFVAFLHTQSWEMIVGGLDIFAAVTFGYAAMPALLVEHVTPAETGVANSVNSVARSVGSSLASALVVMMLTRNLIPGLPVALPQERQFVLAFLVGTVGAIVAALFVAVGMPRRRPRHTTTVREAEDNILIAAAGTEVTYAS